MTRPITDVLAVIGGPDAGPPDGEWVRIPVDLNEGCGAKSIFLCVRRRQGAAPITDFRVVMNRNAPAPAGYEHVRGYDVRKRRYSDRQDLNATAGGNYVYLTYTRAPGNPVVDVVAQAWEFPAAEPEPPTDDDGNRYRRVDGDLNRGAGGSFIKLAQLVLPPDPEPGGDGASLGAALARSSR